jgi:probable O-glycosylation ligase (exosortase A-associated)
VLRSLFVLAIFLPGFLWALRSRFAALLLYLWFALFRPQEWLWVDITPLRLSLVLGIVLLVPAALTGLYPDLTHPLSVGMVLFVCSALLAQIGAVAPQIGWEWIDFTVRLVLTCMLLVTLASDEKRLLAVIAVIAGSLGYHAGKAGLMWLVLGGASRFADGLSGAFVDNNGYALGTVMIMPLLLAVGQNLGLLYDGPLRRWIARGIYLTVGFCIFTVVGTYSRGGFLALLAAAFTYVILQRRRFTAISAVLAFAGLLLLTVPIPQAYIDRLQTIRTYEQIGEDSALSRQHFWRVALTMGTSQLFGVGLRQYEAAYDMYDSSYGRYGHRRAVHSSPLQIFAELGPFGALVWSGMFAYAFYVCFRMRGLSRRPDLNPRIQRLLYTLANALITSMAGFLVGGLFLSLALNDITWLTFGIVAALDRIAAKVSRAPTPTDAPARMATPLAFRAVPSFTEASPPI